MNFAYYMSSLTEAIDALQKGQIVLLHDNRKRENEIDMVVAAEYVTPSLVARIRRDAGGLLCLALRHDMAKRLGLVYMYDMLSMLKDVNPIMADLVYDKSPYGDKPAFSIAINHKNTFTGITDLDRAKTITEMAGICSKSLNGSDARRDFISAFRAPGHVPILIASEGLFNNRVGHTELAVYLVQLAGLTPTVSICEMLDGSTYKALSIDCAQHYSRENGLVIVEGGELESHFAKVH